MNTLIIVGNETLAKINFLNKLSETYDIVVPKRCTTDTSLDSTYYKVVSESTILNYISGNVKNSHIKASNVTPDSISGIISSKIAEGYAELYNKKLDYLVLNISYKELSYYLKYYPKAMFVEFVEKALEPNASLNDYFAKVIIEGETLEVNKVSEYKKQLV